MMFYRFKCSSCSRYSDDQEGDAQFSSAELPDGWAACVMVLPYNEIPPDPFDMEVMRDLLKKVDKPVRRMLEQYLSSMAEMARSEMPKIRQQVTSYYCPECQVGSVFDHAVAAVAPAIAGLADLGSLQE